jgi:hypothetical protein
MQFGKRFARASAAAIGVCFFLAFMAGPSARAQDVPAYRVDPYWPKPLPNKWIMQQIPTLTVDKDDHIWVLNRSRQIMPDETGASTTPPRADCCVAGPAVMEFDTEGNLIRGWGGPGYVPGWPREQTIETDKQGNVWLSGMGRGDGIQKFSPAGKLLWDFGHRGPYVEQGPGAPPLKDNNQQTDILYSGVAGFEIDDAAHEIYIAEGENLNHRVLVYDSDAGKFKRGWGGHGIPLSEISNDPVPPYDWRTGPPPDMKGFASLHCIHISEDGLVYVCERGSNRVQVFTKQGKFVSEFFVHPSTPARGPECGIGSPKFASCGTVLNIAFSPAPEQNFLYIADMANNKVWIVNRKEGTTVGSFGEEGRMAGMLYYIDAIGADSHGNIYTGEVQTGKRIQKFVPINMPQWSR